MLIEIHQRGVFGIFSHQHKLVFLPVVVPPLQRGFIIYNHGGNFAVVHNRCFTDEHNIAVVDSGYEVRGAAYLHWWTFIGYFNEIGDGLYSTVMHIRCKRASGKKLDKGEQEFYKNNKDLIDVKEQKSIYELEAEKADEDFLNTLTGR